VYRLQLMILLLLVGAAAPWAQEAETENDTGDAAAQEAAEPENDVTDAEIDELLGLDEDYSEIEDDEFDFTEEVRFEQSTDFPVDI
jgi:hypothetical protein